MSINLKIILGSLAISLIAIGFGALSQNAQVETRRSLLQIYGTVIDPLASLHAADGAAAVLASRLEGEAEAASAQGRSILSDGEADALMQGLSEILEDIRAIPADLLAGQPADDLADVRDLANRLRASRGRLSPATARREVEKLRSEIASTAESVSSDAGHRREEIRQQIEASTLSNRIELGIALMLGLVVAFALSRMIVPPIREAVRIAKAIAAGNLRTPIVASAGGEAGELFKALAATQSSIVDHAKRIERLMDAQANSFDAKMTIQHARFEAALNNMTQALCMFDGQLALIVFNDPFAKMFPGLRLGSSSRDVLDDARFHHMLAPHETGSFVHELPNGPVISVKRRGISGGGLVVTFENITEEHRTSQILEHMAGHDGLTDLPNRRQFCDRLDQLLAEKRSPAELAVLCIDLNAFKAINDSFGHPIGDQLLRAVGARLIAEAGEGNLVARLGGDEFAIIQMQAGQPDAAEALARRIVEVMAEPFEVSGRRLSVGVAVGVSAILRRKGARPTADSVMKDCDLALYAAKAEPQSAYRVFDPSMREKMQVRRAMEVDLQSALERGEFELFYQPIVDVGRQALSGFEALMRWRHPERGLVPPSEFIPLIEDLGLIQSVGLWALHEACQQASAWPGNLTVAVNLSPIQFRSDSLVDDVKAALGRSGLPAGRLQLEVTESLFLDETERVVSKLAALRELGASISMDDFGTGYSSLGYLSRFPFDKIKIDQAFVRAFHKPENMAVIRAVLGLGRALDMPVVAEGIETREQLEMLYREGCREMQGYLFSEPRPAFDLARILGEVAERWQGELLALTRARAEHAA